MPPRTECQSSARFMDRRKTGWCCSAQGDPPALASARTEGRAAWREDAPMANGTPRPATGGHVGGRFHTSGSATAAARAHAHEVNWAAEIFGLAGSGDRVGAAEYLVERLSELVPYAGAALCAFDPIEQRHVTVASCGYPPEVARYLNDGFVGSDPA